MKPLGKNVLLHGAYQLLNVLFPLISGAYIARILTPEGVGQVAYARNLVSYFTMFAALGIPAYGVREIARSSGGERKKLLSELIVLNALSTTLALVLYLAFAFLVLKGDRLALLFSLELVFHYFSMDWLLTGREEYGQIAVRSLLVKLLCLGLLLGFVRSTQDAPAYGLILCLGTGCNSILNARHGVKTVGFALRDLNLRRHLRPVLTLMLSTVTASLYCKLDVTLLGLLGSDAQVGFYTNAHRVVSIVLSLAVSASAVFLPRLSYVYRHRKEDYERYLSAGLKLTLLLAVPGCVGLLIVAEELTAVLFGALFAPAAGTIRILSVLVIIKGVGDLLCYQAIISAGWERHLIAARVAAGLANIALNVLLIPRWGHNGAAMASVVSEGLVNGQLLIPSLKIGKPKLEKPFLLSLLACTAVMAAAAWLGSGSLVISVTAGVAAYGLAAALLKKYLFGGSLCTILLHKEMT